MTDYYKKYLFRWIVFFMVSDVAATMFAWLIAYYLRFEIELFITASGTPYMEYMVALLFLPLPAYLCYNQAGLYDTRKLDEFHVSYVLILKGILFLTIFILAALFFYRSFSFSRLFTGYFLFGTFFLIILFRFCISHILRVTTVKNPQYRRILLIGNGNTAGRFIESIKEIKMFSFQVVDCVAVGNGTGSVKATAVMDDIPKIMQEKKVQEVFIALDIEDTGYQKTINHHLLDAFVDVNVVPDIYHAINLNPSIIDLNGIPVMVLRQSRLHGWYKVLKRLFDIVVGTFALGLFFWLYLILYIAVRLTSKGPVIYSQKRTGMDGENFYIYKFRTMRIDAEKESGAVWAQENDNRTTRIGKFLRKTSLDEIPQIFNVIKGEMSLVGPRPERPELIDSFKNHIPNYMLRHKVKSGITGWAQVNGWRGNTSLEKRIECDLYYITNWSLWLDIKILLMTLKSGFVHPNAY